MTEPLAVAVYVIEHELSVKLPGTRDTEQIPEPAKLPSNEGLAVHTTDETGLTSGVKQHAGDGLVSATVAVKTTELPLPIWTAFGDTDVAVARLLTLMSAEAELAECEASPEYVAVNVTDENAPPGPYVIEHELSDADTGARVHVKSYVPLVPPSLQVTSPVGATGVALVSVTVAVAVVVPPITTEGVPTVTAVAVGDANATDAAEMTRRHARGNTVVTRTIHPLCHDPEHRIIGTPASREERDDSKNLRMSTKGIESSRSADMLLALFESFGCLLAACGFCPILDPRFVARVLLSNVVKSETHKYTAPNLAFRQTNQPLWPTDLD